MAHKFSYLTPQQLDLLIKRTRNLKHKTCFLLMLDCGLRISETVTLRYINFDFKNRTVTIKDRRTLPLSDRLYDTIAQYIQKQPHASNQDFLFPAQKPNTHLTRKALNRVCDTDIIRDIKHIGSRKEYDMSPAVLFILAGMSILRYISYEVGNTSLKLVGGASLMLLMGSRYFFQFSKRKSF